MRKNDEYVAALNKLVEYHLSLKNCVEAALVTLLQADLYSWKSDQSSLRESLYHTAIKYFGEGKYWELGISLLQELRSLKQNALRTPAENIETEREFLLNIRYKDRFFEEYFFVEYFGTGFPPEYLNKKFIYRGAEAEKLGNFVARITKRFPNCEVLHHDPTEEIMHSNVQGKLVG